MKENCVFTGVDFQDPTFPINRGYCGECFANRGKEMKTCCYNVARRLILLNQRDLVVDSVKTLKGKTLSKTSRVRGLNGALINYR